MLLAEEFVLLALDADGRNARGASNQQAASTGVTGALVAELAIDPAAHEALVGEVQAEAATQVPVAASVKHVIDAVAATTTAAVVTTTVIASSGS